MSEDITKTLAKIAKVARPKILVVDDEQSIREFLQIMLKREKMDVVLAQNGKEAWNTYQNEPFDLVITDLNMPEMDGLGLLKNIKTRDPDAIVLMITAFGSTETAVEAMKIGAFDYLSKPFKIDDVKLRIANALEHRHLVQDNYRLRKELGERFSYANIIGSAAPMKAVFEMIKRVAPTDSSVLITGESGSGKELVAKAIHYNSPVANGPFISMNCGAIPENLIESEMFGHKKGAFTGAIADRKGYFQAADGGTLFLDEVGEMPLSMQASLLRALSSEGTFVPVGSTESISSKVRIIAATHRNLEDEVQKKTFREDLYFRLNVIHIKSPALRERKDDIPMLVEFFVERFGEKFGKKIHSVPKETMELLKAYVWPGNVRELENVIERLVALESQGALLPQALPPEILDPLRPQLDSLVQKLKWNAAGVNLEQILSDVEREFVLKALQESDGVKKDAAKLLEISMRSLRYRLEKLGLASGDDD